MIKHRQNCRWRWPPALDVYELHAEFAFGLLSQPPGSSCGMQYDVWYRLYRTWHVTPRGSRYLIIKELGLKDHDYSGFWGLSP